MGNQFSVADVVITALLTVSVTVHVNVDEYACPMTMVANTYAWEGIGDVMVYELILAPLVKLHTYDH